MDLAELAIPAPFMAAFHLIRFLWGQYNAMSPVLEEARAICTHLTSLQGLLQQVIDRPELLGRVAAQAEELTQTLQHAASFTTGTIEAYKAQHGSWVGWATALSSTAFANPAKLAHDVSVISSQLTQAAVSLSGAIGVQIFASVSAGGRSQAMAAAVTASKLDMLTDMVEKLQQQLAHAESPAASKELEWLRIAAAEGRGSPHSTMVAYALKSSQDLAAELDAQAIAGLVGRGKGDASCNSLVLKAPILTAMDLEQWSPLSATLMGAGTYGQVRTGVLKGFDLPVAVKTLPVAVVTEARKSEEAYAHLIRVMRREADIRELTSRPFSSSCSPASPATLISTHCIPPISAQSSPSGTTLAWPQCMAC